VPRLSREQKAWKKERRKNIRFSLESPEKNEPLGRSTPIRKIKKKKRMVERGQNYCNSEYEQIENFYEMMTKLRVP
jgi:hypothetical protein